MESCKGSRQSLIASTSLRWLHRRSSHSSFLNGRRRAIWSAWDAIWARLELDLVRLHPNLSLLANSTRLSHCRVDWERCNLYWIRIGLLVGFRRFCPTRVAGCALVWRCLGAFECAASNEVCSPIRTTLVDWILSYLMTRRRRWSLILERIRSVCWDWLELQNLSMERNSNSFLNDFF